MKRLICVLFLLSAIHPSYAEQSHSAKETIVMQEKAWVAALLTGNMDVVDAMMHPEFRLVRAYSDAAPIDKASYLGMTGMSASSGEVTSAQIDVTDNVAVAQVTWSLDWQREGVGKLPPHFNLTDIWLREGDGKWRIISRVSQVASSPPADSE